MPSPSTVASPSTRSHRLGSGNHVLETIASTPLYLALLPFYTDASVSTNLLAHLSEDSLYKEFAAALEHRALQILLSREQSWGNHSALDVLNDTGTATPLECTVPLSGIERESRGLQKLTAPVSENLANYATGYQLYDIIVRQTRLGGLHPWPEPGVPVHQTRRDGWVGLKNGLFKHIADLSTLVDRLLSFVCDLEKLAVDVQTPTHIDGPGSLSAPADPNSATVRVAEDLIARRKVKKSFNIVDNISYIAFCVNVLAKGFPYMPVLPDSASASDRRWNASTHSAIASVYEVAKGHRPLRQALQLAVGLTPFVLLTPLNIVKQGVCQEETLINTKLRGNQQPPLVRLMEADLWDAVFAVAEGRLGALDALLAVGRKWKETGIQPRIRASEDDRHFYERGATNPYSMELTPFLTYLDPPAPQTWPRAADIHRYTPTNQATAAGEGRLIEIAPQPSNPSSLSITTTYRPLDGIGSRQEAMSGVGPFDTSDTVPQSPNGLRSPGSQQTNTPSTTPAAAVVGTRAPLPGCSSEPFPPDPHACPEPPHHPEPYLESPQEAGARSSSFDTEGSAVDDSSEVNSPGARGSSKCSEDPPTPPTPLSQHEYPKLTFLNEGDGEGDIFVSAELESLNLNLDQWDEFHGRLDDRRDPFDPPSEESEGGMGAGGKGSEEGEDSEGEGDGSGEGMESEEDGGSGADKGGESSGEGEQSTGPSRGNPGGQRPSSPLFCWSGSDLGGGQSSGDQFSQAMDLDDRRALSDSDGSESSATKSKPWSGEISGSKESADDGTIAGDERDGDGEKGPKKKRRRRRQPHGTDPISSGSASNVSGHGRGATLADEPDSNDFGSEIQLVDYDYLRSKNNAERMRFVKTVKAPAPIVISDSESEEPIARLSLTDVVTKCDESVDVQAEDPHGRMHNFKLSVHHQSYSDSLHRLFDASSSREPTDPQLVEFISQEEVNSLTPAQFQRVFSTSAIVVPPSDRASLSPTTFSLSLLESIEHLDFETEIQDQSMLIDDGQYGAWVRVGTLRQLFESTVVEPEKRKCLNGLHFPDPLAGLEGGVHASDTLALRRTRGEPGCPRTFDSSDVAFRLVATQGALHMPHVDNCGDATWVYVVAGEKVWFFLEPRNPSDLSANNLWTSHSLDMSNLDLSKWHVRAVLLTAGTKMFLPPGMSHAVYTKEHSVCVGGHFLPGGSLIRVISGLIHTFFQGKIITNTTFPPTFPSRMNALACYFYKIFYLGEVATSDEGHYPDVSTPSGLMELVLFSCAIELQNALCPLSYQTTKDPHLIRMMNQHGTGNQNGRRSALRRWDLNALPHETRLGNMYARARMQKALTAVLDNTTIVDKFGTQQNPWTYIFFPTLARFIAGLTNYMAKARAFEKSLEKESAEESESEADLGLGDADVSRGEVSLFSRNLEWAAARWPRGNINSLMTRKYGKNRATAVNPIHPMVEFSIQKPAEPRSHHGRPKLDEKRLWELGATVGDALYFSARDVFMAPPPPRDDSGSHRSGIKRSASMAPGSSDQHREDPLGTKSAQGRGTATRASKRRKMATD